MYDLIPVSPQKQQELLQGFDENRSLFCFGRPLKLVCKRSAKIKKTSPSGVAAIALAVFARAPRRAERDHKRSEA